MPTFLHRMGAGLMVTDFDPLRTSMDWKLRVGAALDIPVIEVDAHNIVPCRVVSRRRVMSFDSFRTKVMPLLQDYLVDFPGSIRPDRTWEDRSLPVDWDAGVEQHESGPERRDH